MIGDSSGSYNGVDFVDLEVETGPLASLYALEHRHGMISAVFQVRDDASYRQLRNVLDAAIESIPEEHGLEIYDPDAIQPFGPDGRDVRVVRPVPCGGRQLDDDELDRLEERERLERAIERRSDGPTASFAGDFR